MILVEHNCDNVVIDLIHGSEDATHTIGGGVLDPLVGLQFFGGATGFAVTNIIAPVVQFQIVTPHEASLMSKQATRASWRRWCGI